MRWKCQTPVGGNTAAQRNVISNNDVGINLTNDSSSNRVEGNYIGTDRDAANAIGNLTDGVLIDDNSTLNIIGGNNANVRNIISGNSYGVSIDGANGNRVSGNYIGTDATGNTAIPNTSFISDGVGVLIIDSVDTIVGGNTVGERNLISGNDFGIVITNFSDDNVVIGNYIGTNAAGDTAIPNANIIGNGAGVLIEESDNNTIGGKTASARNLISGNDYGIVITNFSDDNVVIGNYIGTNAAGDAAIPNATIFGNGAGVLIEESDNNTIGGKTASARNLISGNDYGVVIVADATFNHVEGNYIGINAAGDAALPNAASGVFIEDLATANVIGGTSAASRNIISGNGDEGVTITGGAYDNIVQFNYIGTNPSGTSAIPNQFEGVDIDEDSAFCGCTDATGNLIADNLISGNGSSGIEIQDPTTAFNIIVRNKIGTNAAGTAGIPNNDGGIYFAEDSHNNSVGSTNPSDANLIAFNIGAGIIVTDTDTQNHFLANSIHSNTGLGIDLGDDGVTANDALDPDTGPNALQNYPVLSAVTSSVCNAIQVTATLDSPTPDGPFRIEFFANPVADPSNHGEGQIFLGSTTNSGNNLPFTVILPAPALAAGALLAATATNEDNDHLFTGTSEFSLNLVMPVVVACDQQETKPPPPPPPVTQDLGLKAPASALNKLNNQQAEFHILATLGENSNGNSASATIHLFIPDHAKCQQIFVDGVEVTNACVSGIDDGRIELGTVTVSNTRPTDIRVVVDAVNSGAFTVRASIFSNFANIPNQVVLDPNPDNNHVRLLVNPPATDTTLVTLSANNPAQFATCAVGAGCQLNWATSSENNLASFSLIRQVINEPNGKQRGGASTKTITPLGKNGAGASYSLQDTDVLIGGVYRYTLNAIGLNGETQTVFTQQVNVPYGVYLSLIENKTSGLATKQKNSATVRPSDKPAPNFSHWGAFSTSRPKSQFVFNKRNNR